MFIALFLGLAVAAPPSDTTPSDYQRYDTVRYIPDHYRQRRAQFDTETVRQGGIVFLGNSITEFGDWSRLLHRPLVFNRGIAGDNTFGMLDRLNEVIRLRPARLYIEAGINDIGQGVPVGMIVGNISAMVRAVHVHSPQTRVFVWSVLPSNSDSQTDYPEIFGKNAVVAQVDRLLRERAPADRFTYLDLAGRLTDSKGDLDRRYAQPDGLHLNEAGYAVVISIF